MALLDHQVPEDAKELTAELLQMCVGDVCVVKYRSKESGMGSFVIIACGMVAKAVIPNDKSVSSAKIILATGFGSSEEISGGFIEYIYSLSMLPGGPVADIQNLVDPGLQGLR